MNNNNKMEESSHSENLYAYQDNDSQNNEPPKESTAIRRSIGREGNPFGSNQAYEVNNKLSNNNINNNIQSMQINNNNRTLSENQDNLQAPNYDKSSEQRIPNNNNIQQSQQSKQLYNSYNNPNNNVKAYIPHIMVLMLQVFAVVMLAVCYKLGDGDPKNFGQKDYLNEDYKDFGYYFHFLKDVNLMIFIGLGLLYCALKDHQLSSISLVLFVGVVSLELSLFWNYLWNNSFKKKHHESRYDSKFSKIKLDMEEITQIDFFVATVLVSLGAVIGKLTLGQYLIIALFETFFASLNYYLCYFALGGIDTGGSLYIFAFGAIFGFVVSFILSYDDRYKDNILQRNQNNKSDYYSNVISAIGSLFLWLYFPSFNTSRIHYDQNKKVMDIMRYRGIINTYMSMIGSLVATFCTSALVMEERKFKVEHILRASYAGGVIIAGCSNFCAYPWCALLIGFFGGIISVILLYYATPKSRDFVPPPNPNIQNCCVQFLFALKMSDTMGVMYCFGVPGILGGIFTTIFLASLNKIPWKKAKTINELEVEFKTKLEDLFYYNRSPSAQGGIQLGVLFITIAIAFVSGIVTGFIVKFLEYDRNENLFTDNIIFEDKNYFDVFDNKKILSSSENKLNNDDNEEGREVEVNQENNNNNYYIK